MVTHAVLTVRQEAVAHSHLRSVGEVGTVAIPTSQMGKLKLAEQLCNFSQDVGGVAAEFKV